MVNLMRFIKVSVLRNNTLPNIDLSLIILDFRKGAANEA